MAQLVGLGRLVHDAHWKRGIDEMSYFGSRGGGSVWNILVNAAARGVECAGVGVAGNDVRSELALLDNSSLNVNVDRVERFDGRVTSSMHHFARLGGPAVRYQTSSMCQRCHNRPQGPTLKLSGRISAGPSSYDLLPGVFVVDQLSRLTSNWARELRTAGWLTAIDIGYPGYLRFSPHMEIDSYLRSFDLVIVQKSVSHFLQDKFSGEPGQIASHFRCAFMVSDGENGMRVWDGRGDGLSSFSLAAPMCDVIDTVGAGDALMGGILSELISVSSGRLPRSVAPEDLENACSASMERLPSVLGAIGARGHLAGELRMLPGAVDEVGATSCPICGSTRADALRSTRNSRVQRVDSPLAERNLARRRRVLEAIAQPGAAVEAVKEMVDDPRNTVVTGTGGSFAAASALARVLNDVWGRKRLRPRPIATAMRPMDVIRARGMFDRVVGVTYSGGTADVRQALVMAATAGADSWLVTGGLTPLRLASQMSPTRVIAYGVSDKGSPRSRESGFISFVGAAAPVVLFACATASLDLVRDVIRSNALIVQAEEAVSVLSDHFGPRGEGGLAVIGSDWCEPAMLDLESKFVEGGLAPVTLHDSKDFSHGRFQSLSLEPVLSQAVLTLRTGQETYYEHILSRVLRKEVGDLRVVELAAATTESLGMLEMLLAVQNFSVKIGTQRGIDISKPKKIARNWLQLYRWDSPLVGGIDAPENSAQGDDGVLF